MSTNPLAPDPLTDIDSREEIDDGDRETLEDIYGEPPISDDEAEEDSDDESLVERDHDPEGPAHGSLG